MARAVYYTAHDVLDRLLDYTGGSDSSRASKQIKRCILDAYRDLPMVKNWTYYWTRYRIVLSAPYSTGTVAVDVTGGAYERMVTLSSGTWPTDAAKGIVLIDDVEYIVDERKSSTIITLKSDSCPTDDIASGTSYQWYRDTYTLPRDYRASDTVVCLDESFDLAHETPGNLLQNRRLRNVPTMPRAYTIIADENVKGAMALVLDPPSDAARNLDIMYQRIPNPFQTWEATGTATIVAGSTTVTGVSTSFNSSLVGAVIRMSDTTTDLPTGLEGGHPYQEERVIQSISSGVITVSEAFTNGYTAQKFRISDLVDVENGAMMSAYLRCCEKNVAWELHRDDAQVKQAAYQAALTRAKEADARQIRNVMPVMYRSFGDMPLGDDVGT